MAVLNPFFRQSVQNPGMDISTRGPGPSVDTSGQLKLELQMIDNQTKAFNAAMEMGVIYAKAEAQIKEDERDLILRKAGTELIGQSNSIAQGYAQNKKFTVGSVEVDPGEKGFHSYDGFQKDKKAIESDLIKTITKKYNSDGDERLSELLEIQTKTALAQTFGEAEKSIVKNINDQTLFQLAQEGQNALNALILNNDLSKVQSIDGLIDKKQQNGSITLSKAFEMKRKWRREAFTSYAYNLTKTGSSSEEKQKYLNIFESALKIKTGSETKEVNKNTEQFFKDLSLSDILNINQSVGAGAFAPQKAQQIAAIEGLFLGEPKETLDSYGLEIQYTYEEKGANKGKPKSAVIVSKSGVTGLEQAKEIKDLLNENKFEFITAKNILSYAESYKKSKLAKDRKDWIADSWDKNKKLLRATGGKLLSDIGFLYPDITNLSPEDLPSRRNTGIAFPDKPWEDSSNSAYPYWNNSDDRTKSFRNQLETVYSVLKDSHDFYEVLIDHDRTNSKTWNKIEKKFTSLQKRINDIPDLENTDDEIDARKKASFLFKKMVTIHYNHRHHAIFNTSDQDRNEMDLIFNSIDGADLGLDGKLNKEKFLKATKKAIKLKIDSKEEKGEKEEPIKKAGDNATKVADDIKKDNKSKKKKKKKESYFMLNPARNL